MGTLVMIHCGSDAGFAIDSLGEVFLSVALRVEGTLDKVHLSYARIANDPPSYLPEGFHRLLTIDPARVSAEESRRLEGYIREHEIERVLAFDLSLESPAIAPLRRGGVRRLVSYWGAPMSSINRGVKLLAKRIQVRLARRGRPDHFVFESDGMCESAVRGRGIPRRETSVVRLGVDLERFRPPEVAKPAIPPDLTVPPDRLVVFYSGHMEPRKGVAVIVDAARDLVERFDDRRFHFLLCGNRGHEARPYLDRLEGSEAEAHVTFAGYRSDVPSLMRCSDIGVIASTGWDSFTMSGTEMAASGLPVVVSDLPGLRETVVPEVTGIRIPPGDHIALANALRSLADDPERRLEMGVEARRRAIVEFSREAQLSSLTRILKGVAE